MIERLNSYLQRKKALRLISGELDAFRTSEARTKKRFTLRDEDLRPYVNDKTADTGFDRHYVFHVAWACRVVKEINPPVHVDFSSSLHFCTTLSAFIPVKFYDFRPAHLNLSGLESLQGDLTRIQFGDNSIESLSCMHTIEHIGLGRYGDPIDYDGDIKAIAELKRVVKSDGSLLIVVPIGQPRIQFNGQRIYSYDQVLEYFLDGFTLKEFSLIPESEIDGGLMRNATREQADQQINGCGCFWFVKK